MSTTPLDKLTFARWQELVGTKFRVRASPSETVELELVEATRGKSARAPGPGPQYENFALLFHGPATRPLPQAMYLFFHTEAGEFDLFIVPIAREQETFHYQAVFNRVAPPDV